MKYIDSHCHLLLMEDKGLDIVSLLESYRASFSSILDAAVDEKRLNERFEFKRYFPSLKFSAGIHPSGITELDEQWALIERQAHSPDITALGETGLDYFRDYTDHDLQKESFYRHLELAEATGKPVIIHNREADADVLDMVRPFSGKVRGVLHCFCSGPETAAAFLEWGFYISFAGMLTYKNSNALRETAGDIPLDRLLVETDAPYLAPQAFRGQLNHPGHVVETAKCLAGLKNMREEEFWKQIRENFDRLFGA